MENIEEKLKLEFSVLMKSGKDAVWGLISEAEGFFAGIDNPNHFDVQVSDICKEVRSTKKFFFNQYKEVSRFVVEHRRLSALKKEEDSFILL